MTTRARIQTIGPGAKLVDDTFMVVKVTGAWRWHRVDDPSVGGEWRRRMFDALGDLWAYRAAQAVKREFRAQDEVTR